MGQRKQKIKGHAALLAGNPRCTYCEDAAATVEHMPPVSMFRSRNRPQGMEFPACKACNTGTTGADATAAFMARFELGLTPWRIAEAGDLLKSVERWAPGVLKEMFGSGRNKSVMVRGIDGSFHSARQMIGGYFLISYLYIFSAKFGMAIYRKYAGEPLPPTGEVAVQFYLIGTLDIATAASLLSKMPHADWLKQGKLTSHGQFMYNYNQNEKLIGAFASFHDGLRICAFAYPERQAHNYEATKGFMHVRPGEILGMLPKPDESGSSETDQQGAS